jgi:UDP:flavonoid glycosyltransferase YjiC (YdhE family)
MAHIALIITGLRGKLNASLEIANRLMNEGHDVTYISHQDVSTEIEELGLPFIKAPEINFEFKSQDSRKEGTSFIKRFTHHFKNWGLHYTRGKEVLNLEEYENILLEVSPDRVLVDMELHEFIFTTISLEIPITLFTTWFSNKISLQLPPIRTAILPGNGLQGSKFGILLAWTYLRSRFWLRLFIDYLTFKHYRRLVLLRFAKEIGFDTETLIPNNFPPLFSYRELPIVTMAMKELDFPHEYPENLTYAGPMIFVDREKEQKNKNNYDEIKKIISDKTDRNLKLIYCSAGTFITADVAFLKKVIRAVQQQPDWVLILSLGNKAAVSELNHLPDNVHAFSYVPQLEVLKNADCSINHGGINSINECIHFKVPMLVYSGNRYDQNGCAARVTYHKLGMMGNKNLDTPEEIHNNIKKVLNAREFKDNIEKFNDYYKIYRSTDISPLIFV